MEKQSTFGDVVLARKMSSEFGAHQEKVQVKMRYAAQVKSFLCKAEEAHKQTAKSKLQFG